MEEVDERDGDSAFSVDRVGRSGGGGVDEGGGDDDDDGSADVTTAGYNFKKTICKKQDCL